MTNIKLITIITLFFINNSIAQSLQGIVTYKKTIERKVPTAKDKKDPNFNEFQKVARIVDKLLKNAEFELLFNSKESLFALTPSLTLEENSWSKLALSPYGNVKFYNTKTEILSENNIFGEDFLVSNEPLNWKLENETKKIGNFVCHKAIATETKPYRGKMKDFTIAWYCPEINTSFAPLAIFCGSETTTGASP